MDRAQLADFLRSRRLALQPEDVGLPRGSRRRRQPGQATALRYEPAENRKASSRAPTATSENLALLVTA
jgi:hypothetical protein